MIKFIANRTDGRKVLGLILSEENIKRLKNDKPIQFFAQEMSLDKIMVDEIMIA